MNDQKPWILDRRRFMSRMTLLVGTAFAGGLILFFKVFDPRLFVLWLVLAAAGMLFGYLWSLFMWHLFVSPRIQDLEERARSFDRMASEE